MAAYAVKELMAAEKELFQKETEALEGKISTGELDRLTYVIEKD